MSEKYWYCVHLEPDGTQNVEEDNSLSTYFNRIHVSNAKIKEHVSAAFLQHQGDPGMIFAYFNDMPLLTNARYPDHYVGVYGVKGTPNTKKKSDYATIYFDEKPIGYRFFKDVFGSIYLTKREGSELMGSEVRSMMEQKSQQFDQEAYFARLILQRLWSLRENNENGCLVVGLDGMEIQNQSVRLMEKVYRMIPQRLRLSCGFATNCSPQDVRTLREKLPITLVTMRHDQAQQWDDVDDNIQVCLLSELSSLDDAGRKRVQQLGRLQELCNTNPELLDAKLAYAEEQVGRSSFKHLQEIIDTVLGENGKGFWWSDDSLETVDAIYQAGSSLKVKKLMESDDLSEEAKYILNEEISYTLSARFAADPYREQLCRGEISAKAIGFFSDFKEIKNLIDTIHRSNVVADEVNTIAREKLETANQDLKKNLEDMQQQLGDERSNNSDLTSKLQSEQEENLKLTQEKETLEGSRNELEAQLSEKEGALKQKENENSTLRANLQISENAIQGLKDEANKKEKDIQAIQAENVGLKNDKKKLEAALEEADKKIGQLERTKTQKGVEELQEHAAGVEEKNQELSKDKEKLKTQNTELKKQLNIFKLVCIGIAIFSCILMVAICFFAMEMNHKKSEIVALQSSNHSLYAENMQLKAEKDALVDDTVVPDEVKEVTNSMETVDPSTSRQTRPETSVSMEESTEETEETMEMSTVESTRQTEMQSSEDTFVNSRSSDYLLPESNIRYLSASDIENLSVDQLQLAVNELYARHGLSFAREELRDYFESKSWYRELEKVYDADVIYANFSDIERSNFELLAARLGELNAQ